MLIFDISCSHGLLAMFVRCTGWAILASDTDCICRSALVSLQVLGKVRSNHEHTLLVYLQPSLLMHMLSNMFVNAFGYCCWPSNRTRGSDADGF